MSESAGLDEAGGFEGICRNRIDASHCQSNIYGGAWVCLMDLKRNATDHRIWQARLAEYLGYCQQGRLFGEVHLASQRMPSAIQEEANHEASGSHSTMIRWGAGKSSP